MNDNWKTVNPIDNNPVPFGTPRKPEVKMESFTDKELRDLLKEVDNLSNLIAPSNQKLSSNMQKLFDESYGQFWSSKFNDTKVKLDFEARKRFLEQGE
jgi:hypothetical protein